LGVEAPRCQDAATKACRAYFEELQRRQWGWIGVTIIRVISKRALSWSGKGADDV